MTREPIGHVRASTTASTRSRPPSSTPTRAQPRSSRWRCRHLSSGSVSKRLVCSAWWVGGEHGRQGLVVAPVRWGPDGGVASFPRGLVLANRRTVMIRHARDPVQVASTAGSESGAACRISVAGVEGAEPAPSWPLIVRPIVSIHRPDLRRRPPGSSRVPSRSLMSFRTRSVSRA